MNDIKLILFYNLKIKVRELKYMIKNLFLGFIIVFIVFGLISFQCGKMIILNLELINLYCNQIVLAVSILILIFTLVSKKMSLEWHPANMMYLSGAKFLKIIKLSLLKKVIPNIILSILIALILNSFKVKFQTIQVFLSLFNLFILSISSRLYIYNKGLNVKIVCYLIIYVLILNLQLYINKYLSIILILCISYISIISIKKVFKINIDFSKTFTEMVFNNKVKHVALGNTIEDPQKFVREISAKKNRANFILKYVKFKNPLIQKNLITFLRIDLFPSFLLFVIFILVIFLYKFELFEFVKTIKDLGIGLSIVALQQASFINNIIELITYQKNRLIIKSKEGLYLPYKKYEIIKSFMALGIPLLFIITLIVVIFFQKPIWVIIIGLIIYSIIMFIALNFEKKKNRDFFRGIIYFIIFVVSYLLIM